MGNLLIFEWSLVKVTFSLHESKHIESLFGQDDCKCCYFTKPKEGFFCCLSGRSVLSELVVADKAKELGHWDEIKQHRARSRFDRQWRAHFWTCHSFPVSGPFGFLVAFLHHHEKTMGLRACAVCSTLEHIPVKHTTRWQVTHLCGRAGDPHLTPLPSPPSSDLPPASNWLVWVGEPTRQSEQWGFGRCLPQAFYCPPSLQALLPAVPGGFLSPSPFFSFSILNRIDCLVWLQGQERREQLLLLWLDSRGQNLGDEEGED